MSHHRITSISVVGGFIDETRAELSDGLNCLIGGRGTGKTTFLELIRFVLNVTPDESRPSARRQFDSLVDRNLNGGRVQLNVETKEGLRYTISRSAGESPIIAADGQDANVSFQDGQFFPVDIYSQNEVESIADESVSQISLIDRFEPKKLGEIERQLEQVRLQLAENTNATVSVQVQIGTLTQELSQLPVVQDQLRQLAQSVGGDEAEVNQAHRVKSLRDREARAFDSSFNLLDATHTATTRVFPSKGNSCFNGEMREGPNGQLMSAADDAFRGCVADVEELLQQIHDRIAVGQHELQTRQRELLNRHAQQELEFRKVIERQRQAQGQANERMKKERQRNDLLEKQRTKEELEGRAERLARERGWLIVQLSNLQTKRYEIRMSIVDRINAALSPAIRVTLMQSGNPVHYRRMLEAELKDSRMQHNVVAERLASAFWPHELIEVIQEHQADRLSAELNPDQAAKVIRALGDKETLLNLETVELLDLPQIELKDGDVYKESSCLSTGQKCTAILPILLMESENPLLIDQPEDNLDNRFIFETVVDSLNRVKQSRQLVFVTHNPNIPVLADAEQVLVFRSDGQRAGVRKTGNVDHCKNEIVTVLEGGEEAFKQRKLRYAY